MLSAGIGRRWRSAGLGFGLAGLVLASCGADDSASEASAGSTGEGSTTTTATMTTSVAIETESSTATTLDTASGETGEADILDLLEAIPGIVVEERFDSSFDGRFFEMTYRLPNDHEDPGAGEFDLYMTLLHRSVDAPTVFYTTGYHNYLYDRELELSWLVGGNQLSVEKRFTGISTPDADWTKLSASQVAADGHLVVEALSSVYSAPWLRSGASLGGEDAVYHHYIYPEDFAGVVAYVAPFVLGLADERFVDHFAEVVDQPCQAHLEALQVAMLTDHRPALVAELEQRMTADEITRVGSHDAALQTLVLELPWSVWQSTGPGICDALPAVDDPELSSETLFELLDEGVNVLLVRDVALETFDAYSYQAFTQLGRPALPLAHLEGLIDPDYVDMETGSPPPGVELPFDATFVPAVVAWVATEATDLIFVYGDLDPWSAGRIEVSENPGVASYHNPTGLHGTSIASLSAADEAAVEAEIEAWIGDRLGHLAPVAEGSEVWVPR